MRIVAGMESILFQSLSVEKIMPVAEERPQNPFVFREEAANAECVPYIASQSTACVVKPRPRANRGTLCRHSKIQLRCGR